MPRKPEFTARYADALHVLEVATHRPARVVNIDGRYALRVDFEHGRYLMATNTVADVGLDDSRDADAESPWRVLFFDGAVAGRPTLLADETRAWLIDAYDAAVGLVPTDASQSAEQPIIE
ncbi:hypothetical protein ACWDTI_21125 [Gordonia sp. NPDC003424]